MRLRSNVPLSLLLACSLLLVLVRFPSSLAADDSTGRSNAAFADEINATAAEFNASRLRSKEDSFADMIDRALEKEFTENDQNEATDPGSFNNSVAGQQAVLETVARVKSKKNDTKEEKSFQLHTVFNLDNENRPEDTPMLIDRKDNVFIISNPKSKYPVLQLDLRLISDLVVVIVSATCGGIAFACAGQLVITRYLLAGSFIGPGGFSFVTELVQVETVAQFGVNFLLFALGLEFSATKLRVVRAVAVLGGLLQIFLFICLCGITASCSDKLGLSLELGSFAAGVMISTTDLAQHTLEQGKLYLLLLGTTTLSLVTTPWLFKLIPAVVHLGVLLGWFTPDSPSENGYKGDSLRAESAKRIAFMVQGSHDS